MTWPIGTVRARMTALYGGLFLAGGALLLTITYVLVASHIDSGGVSVSTGPGGETLVVRGQFSGSAPPIDPNASVGATAKVFKDALAQQRAHELDQLLLWSGAALAFMALASVVLGWLMAGRVLAPLRTMTAKTRRISADNLDARLALTGPKDELKELGDTIDGLLGRLEQAFDAQRRFVANASHELRTPLTLERAMIEVALADPKADVESLRAVCARVLAAGEEQERLIEALLTLARSQRGLERREPVDLRAAVSDALADATPNGVCVESALEDANVGGDPQLVRRLAANLLDNAVRHNVPDGWVHVETATVDGEATLRVANSGPWIPDEQIPSLLQPFRRARPERASHQPGHGLGLSIVTAIAASHAARLAVRPRTAGGLDVEVRFPPA
jgi:signal transduction histidine kinase